MATAKKQTAKEAVELKQIVDSTQRTAREARELTEAIKTLKITQQTVIDAARNVAAIKAVPKLLNDAWKEIIKAAGDGRVHTYVGWKTEQDRDVLIRALEAQGFNVSGLGFDNWGYRGPLDPKYTDRIVVSWKVTLEPVNQCAQEPPKKRWYNRYRTLQT